MSDKIRLYGVKWSTKQGGPSPDENNRTELYFMGCDKAVKGNPCEGCFNPDLWETKPGAIERSPEEMAAHISKHAPNKFITIVGGEPTDQLEGLTKLCRLLKADGFHIIVFTWRSMVNKLPGIWAPEYAEWVEMLKHVDIIVDGQYDSKHHIYDYEAGDGFHDAIGSGNQIVWDLNEWNSLGHPLEINGLAAGDLEGLYVLPSGELRYITKEQVDPQRLPVVQKGVA